MTETMVERVARAIGETCRQPGSTMITLGTMVAARAAIAAMREPTEHQLRSAWEKAHCNIDDFWREFIDAALNERQEAGE